MAREIPTKHKGIYQRGTRFVFRYQAAGKQRRGSAATITEAKRMKRAMETDRDRGEFQPSTQQTFPEYAREWIERYQGTGGRGFTENTRKEYRRDLERYAYPSPKLDRKLTAITPHDVALWVAWLCEQSNGRKGKLSDKSVRRLLAPVRSCFATARAEGLIRAANPADRVALPNRKTVKEPGAEDEEVRRVFTRQQLDAFLRVVHPDHRLMFELLAATGLRWSELIELHWADLRLDGSEPCVRVRRALVKRELKPPKSKHGKRDVPLSPALVSKLRQRRCETQERMFMTPGGKPLDYSTTLRRVLRPAAEEAGAPWAAFHSFRHTFASLHIARDTNILALSRMLGHHSPEFTLSVYGHLIPGDRIEPLDISAEVGRQVGSNGSATEGNPGQGFPSFAPERAPQGIQG